MASPPSCHRWEQPMPLRSCRGPPQACPRDRNLRPSAPSSRSSPGLMGKQDFGPVYWRRPGFCHVKEYDVRPVQPSRAIGAFRHNRRKGQTIVRRQIGNNSRLPIQRRTQWTGVGEKGREPFHQSITRTLSRPSLGRRVRREHRPLIKKATGHVLTEEQIRNVNASMWGF